MTKQELIELVIERLRGGDTTSASRSKYHPVVVEKTIEIGYNDTLKNMLDQVNNRSAKFPIDHLIRTYYFKPILDNNRDQYYVETTMSLDVKLIRQVSQPKNRNASFAFMSTSSEPMWSELDVTKVDSTIGYMVENKKIYFDDMFNSQFGNIMVKMVPNFDGLSMDDDINIPLEPILDYCDKYWNNQRTDDQINDNEQIQGRQQ